MDSRNEVGHSVLNKGFKKSGIFPVFPELDGKVKKN